MSAQPPAYLTPASRVEILREVGLGAGWVLLTMKELDAIRSNVAAYKVERPEIIEAAYRLTEALVLVMSTDVHSLPEEDKKAKLAWLEETMKLPLPPRPLANPFADEVKK
jgi:hypothetical protein